MNLGLCSTQFTLGNDDMLYVQVTNRRGFMGGCQGHYIYNGQQINFQSPKIPHNAMYTLKFPRGTSSLFIIGYFYLGDIIVGQPAVKSYNNPMANICLLLVGDTIMAGFNEVPCNSVGSNGSMGNCVCHCQCTNMINNQCNNVMTNNCTTVTHCDTMMNSCGNLNCNNVMSNPCSYVNNNYYSLGSSC